MGNSQESNTTAVELPDWTSRPVLIYGPRKAGTTLLQNLHDGGELLVFPIELKLKELLLLDWSDPAASVTQYFERQRILGDQFPHFDARRYEALSQQNVGNVDNLRDLLCRDAMNVFQCVTCELPTPTAWAFKEVGGPTKQVVRAFRQHFYGAKIVMILRNPRMVTRSVLMDRRRKQFRMSWKRLIKEIRDPIRVLYEQLLFLKDPNVFFITYEDLTGSEVRNTMQPVAKFLGIPYSEVFERPTIFGEPVVTRTSSQKTSAVFAGNHQWYDDLRLHERFLIALLSRYFERHYQRKTGAPHRTSYQEVTRQLASRSAA